MRFLILFMLVLGFADASLAQTVSLDMGEGGGQVTSRIIQLLALITVLSLAPSILVMVTSFTRIVIVFSFLRTAIGLQQTPPNAVIISLSLFLTMFIMEPVFMQSYNNGLKPLMDNKITEEQAFEPTILPFKKFMLSNVRQKDLGLFFELSNTKIPDNLETTPLRIIIPAFMISELRRAFEIGFLLFIPFLVIDLMIASTLMAMGMMMLPPVLISLPFKLIFFVLIDGWYMVVGSLVKSFAS